MLKYGAGNGMQEKEREGPEGQREIEIFLSGSLTTVKVTSDERLMDDLTQKCFFTGIHGPQTMRFTKILNPHSWDITEYSSYDVFKAVALYNYNMSAAWKRFANGYR